MNCFLSLAIVKIVIFDVQWSILILTLHYNLIKWKKTFVSLQSLALLEILIFCIFIILIANTWFKNNLYFEIYSFLNGSCR